MKIVIFSRFPNDPGSPSGGVETATLGLVRGLVAINAGEIHLVTLEFGVTELTIEHHEGITVHRLPRPKFPMLFDVLFNGPGCKLVKAYIDNLKPDIVHFHETYGLAVQGLSAPKVFTVHGFDSLNLPTEKKSNWWIRSKIWRIAEQYRMKHEKHIISITPYVRDEIEARTQAKIHDIDNAISKEFFSLERNEVLGRVFFAGWINPRKNPLGLVKAFSKVVSAGVDAELHLAGACLEPDYLAEIEKTIEINNLSGKVKLLGKINQSQIRHELTQASIFVLPSYQENAPMAISESMAVGVPVISSNVCGMPYMLKDKKTGFLVDPDDHQAMADIMIQLLRDESLRSQVTAQAKIDATERYHPEAVAKKTLAVYDTLIQEWQQK